jgi:hypothetical protein
MINFPMPVDMQRRYRFARTPSSAKAAKFAGFYQIK